MSNQQTLRAALLAAFKTDAEDAPHEAAADALATVLCAFADVVRGPAPELLTAELVADDTPRQLLCELIYEIRADRQERAQAMRQLSRQASGLPS